MPDISGGQNHPMRQRRGGDESVRAFQGLIPNRYHPQCRATSKLTGNTLSDGQFSHFSIRIRKSRFFRPAGFNSTHLRASPKTTTLIQRRRGFAPLSHSTTFGFRSDLPSSEMTFVSSK